MLEADPNNSGPEGVEEHPPQNTEIYSSEFLVPCLVQYSPALSFLQ